MTFPDAVPRWRRYIRFWRTDVQADIDEELRFHFETRIEDLVASGMSEPRARAQAAEEFGDVAGVRRGLRAIGDRVVRRRSRIERLDGLCQDIAFALRSIRRTPGVAFAILSTLALGLGVNAATFTLLETIFVRPPAGIVRPTDLRRVYWQMRSGDGLQFWPGFSYPQYRAVVDEVGGLAAAAIYTPPRRTRLGAGESADRVQVSYASASYFSVLGVRAEIGRTYSDVEDAVAAPANVAVVSRTFWQGRLGGDSAAVGKPIKIGGTTYTVIGVAKGTFTGVDLDAADVWLPLGFVAKDRARPGESWWLKNRVNGFHTFVRPNVPGRDRELEQRLTLAFRQPDARFQRAESTTVARVGSIVEANGPGRSGQEVLIAVRLGGVAIIVLLITCANVVNLLLARAVRRRREIAVRLALGISRARLFRLLLTESVVLALAAAIVSLGVAYWGGGLLRSLLLPDVHWARSALDWSVGFAAVAIAFGAGIVAGLIPAIQAARPQVVPALKASAGDGGVQHSRLRSTLVVVQAALSVVLLVGAMLFVRSLANVRALHLGFDAQQLTIATVTFDDRAGTTEPSWSARLSELAERVAKVPGVESVALTSMEPMSGFSWVGYFTGTDTLGSRKGFFPTTMGVSPSYFATVGLRITRGEGFPALRGTSMPQVVVVNEEMARVLWPASNPIGQCIRFEKRDGPCYTVSGVVENGRRDAVIEEPAPQYYLPADRLPLGTEGSLTPWYVAIRSSPSHAATVTTDVQRLIRQVFPNGVPSIRAMSERLAPQYRPWQLGAILFTTFGILALVVSAIGIYSTVSYAVTQRTHEFGVRIALGARVGDILRLVLTEGIRTVAVGVAVGVLLTLAGGRLIASLLYGIAPSDPTTMIAVAATLLAIAALAAFAPAWRASRVDAVTALRAD
ncbi:MAG: ADOP family duplicated permease [bacterium]